jgi:hypothetical protein
MTEVSKDAPGTPTPASASDSVTVSQVDQIADLFSDYTSKPGEPGKDAPALAVPPVPVSGPAPVAAPASVPVPEPVKEGVDATIATLTEQIKTLSAKIAELSTPKPAAEPVKAEPPKPEPPVLTMGFFKDKAEYEAAFEKPEVMSEVMDRVKVAAKVEAVQAVLKSLPQVINNTIKAQLEVQARVTDFFKENEDLKAHKDFVGYVSNDLSGKNPDWTLAKLFEELPKEVRKRIGLKEEAPTPAQGGPAQPPRSRTPRTPVTPEPAMSSLEKEISELM